MRYFWGEKWSLSSCVPSPKYWHAATIQRNVIVILVELPYQVALDQSRTGSFPPYQRSRSERSVDQAPAFHKTPQVKQVVQRQPSHRSETPRTGPKDTTTVLAPSILQYLTLTISVSWLSLSRNSSTIDKRIERNLSIVYHLTWLTY